MFLGSHIVATKAFVEVGSTGNYSQHCCFECLYITHGHPVIRPGSDDHARMRFELSHRKQQEAGLSHRSYMRRITIMAKLLD